jgi:hypothetical protein
MLVLWSCVSIISICRDSSGFVGSAFFGKSAFVGVVGEQLFGVFGRWGGCGCRGLGINLGLMTRRLVVVVVGGGGGGGEVVDFFGLRK